MRGRWALLLLPLLWTGCVDGAKLVQATDRGGTVVYPLKKDQESIYSPFRSDALALMDEYCHGNYVIVREGETRGQAYPSGREGEEQVSVRRFWGLQFRCK